MRFKNSSQRKAVMARLKGMNYSQLQSKGIFLKYHGDRDNDGVPNIHDCKPLDSHRQGFIHDWLKKREKRLDREIVKKNKLLEKQQDKLLSQADNENTRLRKYQEVERKLAENKKIKQDIKDMRKAEFRMTNTGKVLAATGKGTIIVGKTAGKGIIMAGQGLNKLAHTRTAKKLYKKIFS